MAWLEYEPVTKKHSFLASSQDIEIANESYMYNNELQKNKFFENFNVNTVVSELYFLSVILELSKYRIEICS